MIYAVLEVLLKSFYKSMLLCGDSKHKLKDMLPEFQPDGKFYSYLLVDEQGNQTINLEGFRVFLFEYFGVELPIDLVDHLFHSFSKPPVKDNLSKLERLTIGTDSTTLDKIPEEGERFASLGCAPTLTFCSR
ncbi:unnamed protein product [Heligmosomoides polygyrus]|uniref:DAG_kinase_N domain-containing protein n=1 Tax=Heligmosomoides polygyrus TaxID=6339 RepID=A0A183FSU9_HELPZ|nr:unnamed protein product [Heligmosomoides polygyrus]